MFQRLGTFIPGMVLADILERNYLVCTTFEPATELPHWL